MRFVLSAALVICAIGLAPITAAAHGRGPWCVIVNNGKATWICYPTHTLCRHFGEVPDSGRYCVQNPAWSGG